MEERKSISDGGSKNVILVYGNDLIVMKGWSI